MDGAPRGERVAAVADPGAPPLDRFELLRCLGTLLDAVVVPLAGHEGPGHEQPLQVPLCLASERGPDDPSCSFQPGSSHTAI